MCIYFYKILSINLTKILIQDQNIHVGTYLCIYGVLFSTHILAQKPVFSVFLFALNENLLYGVFQIAKHKSLRTQIDFSHSFIQFHFENDLHINSYMFFFFLFFCCFYFNRYTYILCTYKLICFKNIQSRR